VTVTTHPDYRYRPGPLHAMLLAGTVPLFLGALLSDIAYYNSFQIQWANFAAWLIAGGLLFAGLALLFALANLLLEQGDVRLVEAWVETLRSKIGDFRRVVALLAGKPIGDTCSNRVSQGMLVRVRNDDQSVHDGYLYGIDLLLVTYFW
jgi:hypothetical protein